MKKNVTNLLIILFGFFLPHTVVWLGAIRNLFFWDSNLENIMVPVVFLLTLTTAILLIVVNIKRFRVEQNKIAPFSFAILGVLLLIYTALMGYALWLFGKEGFSL